MYLFDGYLDIVAGKQGWESERPNRAFQAGQG